MATLFPDLVDSPAFRSQVDRVDLDSLMAKTQKLMKAAKVYARQIDAGAQATLSFAEGLEAFCVGQDDHSISVGAPLFMKFVPVLRELASFQELLVRRTGICARICGESGALRFARMCVCYSGTRGRGVRGLSFMYLVALSVSALAAGL
jgi:hypothetical protein